eukprot:gnl/Spiro4/29528_TR14455_c0_g1_i1.p1 gnl/Spiro4/29528_TR14455_c0_g1~~gnl/Spiro4/29528_TR14455_c0_g1_i1.p1  ORF type:complete len:400 (+),score=-51.45 gnl/Spiro4/29528_TR14455_c0_g1_i1:2029-3228(+)
MIPKHTVGLLKKFLGGKATLLEKAKVNKWYDDIDKAQLKTEIEHDEVKEALFQKIIIGLNKEKKAKVIPLLKNATFYKVLAVACSFTVVVFIGFKLMDVKQSNKSIAQTKAANDVVAPQSSKAMITLSNGKKVPLDSIYSGTLASQNGINVLKNADGSIAYSGQSNVLAYNTLSNPRGSAIVTMMLEDGTKVWLNSESSIKFPTAFIGNERKVEITGEAYFEVKSIYLNAGLKKPFIVHINSNADLALNTPDNNGAEVEVLGTHFNIKAYSEEKFIKSTLLEGSIKMTSQHKSVLITPNQQAKVIPGKADIKVVDSVNVDEVLAWKNGFFQFSEANIETVMKQISRWYDVTIIYQGKGELTDHFNGKIPRTFSLAKVLKILELNDIRVKIQGKNLIIQN